MKVTQKPILHGRDHLPGGPDPIPGVPNPFGDDLSGVIMSHDPVGFWKLNEQSGTTAHDSSGNGNDMDPPLGKLPPVWGQTAGPPGDTSAKWVDTGPGGSDSYREACLLTGQTNNFTAGVWFNALSTGIANANELIGQGSPVHSGAGWEIIADTSPGEITLYVPGDSVDSNANMTVDTWYFVSVVRDSGTWKLYINGLLQSDSSSTSPGATPADTWIGNDNFASHSTFARDVLMSYAFIVDSVISGDDIMEIYNTGNLGGSIAANKVWTALGDGTAAWRDPTILVEY